MAESIGQADLKLRPAYIYTGISLTVRRVGSFAPHNVRLYVQDRGKSMAFFGPVSPPRASSRYAFSCGKVEGTKQAGERAPPPPLRQRNGLAR